MATIGKLAVLLTANSAGMVGGVRVGVRSLTSLGDTATSVTSKLAAMGGGLTIALGLKKASDTANSFEKVMDDVGARIGASDRDMAALNDRARELSASKPFKPFEAGAAMVELVKGGIEDIAAVKSISGDVLNLSGAENGLELARSAEIVVKSMSQFDLATSQSGRIVDSFAITAGSAATDVDQLAHQLTAAAPGANALGKSLEDTLALLGALSGPLGADQVGTAVRGMFDSMKSPSAQAKTELDSLGLSFFDVAGKIKPVTQIVDEFRNRLSGMTDEQKGASLGKLFEARAGNAFLALLNGADSKVADIRAKLGEAGGGFAENLANAKLDNVTGSFDGFLSKLDNLSIGIFKPLETARKAFWSGLGDSIAAATPWIEKASTAVSGLIGSMGRLDWRPALAIAGGIASIVPVAIGAKVALYGLRVAGMLLAPIVPVIRAARLALVGFGPAAAIARAALGSVVMSGLAVGKALPAAFAQSGRAVAAMATASARVATVWAADSARVAAVSAAAGLRVTAVWAATSTAVVGRLALIRGSAAFSAVTSGAAVASRAAMASFAGMAGAGRSASLAISGAFGRSFAILRSTGGIAIRSIVVAMGSIKVAAAAAFAPIKSIAGAALTPIAGMARSAAAGIAPAFSSAFAGIAGMIAPVIGLAGAVALPILAIGGAAGAAFLLTKDGTAGIRNAWASVKEHSAGIFSQMQSVAMAAFNVMLSGARTFLAIFGVEFDTTGASVAGGFAENMKSAGDWIEGALIDVEFFLNNFGRYFDLAVLHAQAFVASIAGSIGHFFTATIPELLGYFGRNWQDVFLTAGDFVGTVFQNLANNVKDIFSEVWDYIASAGSDGIEFNLTPLTDGFQTSITETLALSDRAMSDTEQRLHGAIDSLSQSLAGNKERFVAQRKSELDDKNFQQNGLSDFQAMVDKSAVDGGVTLADIVDDELNGLASKMSGDIASPDALASTMATDPMASAEPETPGVALQGTSEAYEAIYRSISGGTDKPAKETAKNTASIADSMKKLIDAPFSPDFEIVAI